MSNFAFVVFCIFVILVNMVSLTYMSQFAGVHYIVDIDNADPKLAYDNQALIKICDETLQHANVTVINKANHAFHPHGLTLLYLLTESHFSLHTWPEHGKLRIDFFSCQNHDKCERGCDYLKKAFHGADIKIMKLFR